jgi:hypothetical protein
MAASIAFRDRLVRHVKAQRPLEEQPCVPMLWEPKMLAYRRN